MMLNFRAALKAKIGILWKYNSRRWSHFNLSPAYDKGRVLLMSYSKNDLNQNLVSPLLYVFLNPVNHFL
jgi:hypothetical protein